MPLAFSQEVSLLSKPSIEESTSVVFLQELYRQVEKMTLFVIKQQGEIADAFLDVRNQQLNAEVPMHQDIT